MKKALAGFFALLSAATAATAVDLPPRGPLRVVILSDFNENSGSTDYGDPLRKAVEWIREWKPDLVLLTGDMIAAGGPPQTDANLHAMWRAFDREVFIPIRSEGISIAFTLGNHDIKAQNERVRATEYWRNRKDRLDLDLVSAENFPFHYTFVHKGVFFSSLEVFSANISDEQLAWADRALAAPEAVRAPLRIAMGHLPIYAVAEGRNLGGEVISEPARFLALCKRHGVWGYLSGHDHAFFPGQADGLKFLHGGGLANAAGGGARVLLGTTLAPRKTVTVLDIEPESGKVRYTAIDVEMEAIIAPESLPEAIESRNGVVRRWIPE